MSNQKITSITVNGKEYDLIEKQEPKKEPILVPENIKITRKIGNCSQGLVFDNNQELYWRYNTKSWGVFPVTVEEEHIQTQLIPCKREDLIAGDLAFRTYKTNPDFSHRPCYCLITNEEPIYISSKFPYPDSNKYPYWYKVVKL